MPKLFVTSCALFALALSPAVCCAAAPDVATTAAAAPQTTNTDATSTQSGEINTAQPLTVMSLDDLSSVSAGSGADNNVVSRQQLTAVNSGNSVNAATVTTGTISLDGSALSGYNGVGNFVMNTGNNNNLQGSLSVNISGVGSK